MSVRIDPRFTTATQWTALSATVLAPYATIPILLRDEDWLSWARYVVGIPAVQAVGAPRPEGFADWQSWATAFNGSLTLLTT